MEDILKGLNPEQEKAVIHDDGPLLIVAGAGTGKTTVITRRVAWLIETGRAKADEILVMTFTEKAAGEMEERVDRLLPYGYLDLWISTFHSFGERILRAHALDVGLPAEFRLLNETQQWLLVRNNLDRFDLDYYRPLGNPTSFIRAMTVHFSRAKDEMVSPEDYLKYAGDLELDKDAAQDGLIGMETARLKEIANAYHAYQQLLLENGAFDFGDLINRTLDLFKQRPLILEKYRKQFKYVLVDEFQDTNYAQYELVKILAAPRNNLTVCADDDQSIYKFRGASASNVLQFKQDFPKAEDVILVRNYRSKQEILDLSYEFIQLNNPDRLEYRLGKGSGGNLSKELVAQSEGRADIKCLSCRTKEEEASKVLKKIMELREKDGKVSSWNDFAILVRANSHADLFCQALERSGIPYDFLASSGLFAKPVILDALAYLELLDNYHESPAVFRVLNVPILDIDSADLHKLTHYAYKKGWPLIEAVKACQAVGVGPRSQAEIEMLLGWLSAHAQLARKKSVSSVLLSFLGDSGYLKFIASQGGRENAENLSYLNQFFKKVEEFELSSEDKTLAAFMKYLDMVIESGDRGNLKNEFDEGPESVKVMTVHSSKGLEFKYVFIVNMVDRRFPTTERRGAIELPDSLVKEIVPEGDAHLQEERRLFYVAMTRAKEGLYFALAQDYGGARKKKPSRFMSEAGFENLEPTREEPLPKSRIERLKARPAVKKYGKPSFPVPSKFSFTQLKGFETCPLQYKYSHLLRIPTEGRATFSFGQAMHGALEKFFNEVMKRQESSQGQLFDPPAACLPTRQGEAGVPKGKSEKIPVSLDELLQMYEESWIDDWFGNKKREAEYLAKGRQSLKDFYADLEKNGLPQVKYLEMGFNFKVRGSSIKGRIDRVDSIPGEGLEIIDYKTGKAKEKLSADAKEQLLIYKMAAEEILGEKVIKLTFHYLDENKKFSFEGSEKDLARVRERIVKRIEGIKKAIDTGEFPASPGFHCKFCDFRKVCDKRQ